MGLLGKPPVLLLRDDGLRGVGALKGQAKLIRRGAVQESRGQLHAVPGVFQDLGPSFGAEGIWFIYEGPLLNRVPKP